VLKKGRKEEKKKKKRIVAGLASMGEKGEVAPQSDSMKTLSAFKRPFSSRKGRCLSCDLLRYLFPTKTFFTKKRSVITKETSGVVDPGRSFSSKTIFSPFFRLLIFLADSESPTEPIKFLSWQLPIYLYY